MTQISGKIYQMTNGKTDAQLENRFPRTVIEAVYGLSSYLQQQFASLADIYMPIEGISEALTGQEFVFRKAPNTIKAKSLTLDKILGKTLAWNSLIDDSGYSVVSTSGVTFTKSGHTITANGTASATSYCGFYNSKTAMINGHKYVFTGFGSSVGSDSTFEFMVVESVGSLPVKNIYQDGVFTYSGTTRMNAESQFVIRSGYNAQNLKVTPVLVDLTFLYGSDISGLTDAQILAKYESEFGGIYGYNAGSLISNDTSSLETTGRNVWDEEWEVGGIDDSTGQPTSMTGRIRTKNFIPVLPSTQYFINTNGTSISNAFCYDANKNFIGLCTLGTAVSGNYPVTTKAGTSYMKVGFSVTYGGTYNHNICINLYDASFNGQYAPYKKSVLHLGLNEFKVKSPNIWDEEDEAGGIHSGTGANDDTSTVVHRSKNYIPVLPGTTYYVKISQSCYLRFYRKDKSYIGYQDKNGNGSRNNNEMITPDDCYFFRFVTDTAIAANSITINVSSPAFNGRYFSHEDITITGGLKGNGDWSDYIVGNKYVKRCGVYTFTGSESWSLNGSYQGICNVNLPRRKDSTYWGNPGPCIHGMYAVGGQGYMYNNTAPLTIGLTDSTSIGDICTGKTVYDNRATLTGTDFYYALANPETYELVEPLVPTMKAGTTEARISPNADGLSAPFRADMTYSAQENNDSASSQYAAVAGRLLNPQTIWGQTFDGSSPVTGSLSGVQNISMAGNITGAVSISAKALTHPSGNLTIGDSGNDDFINIVEDTNIKQQFRLEKGAKFGTSSNLLLEWDATNNALRFHGNFIADGFGSFGGVQPSGSEIFCAAVLGPANYQFVNVAGIVDGPNEEYFVPPSSDAIADGNIDRAHVFATKADIDALSARITALGG